MKKNDLSGLVLFAVSLMSFIFFSRVGFTTGAIFSLVLFIISFFLIKGEDEEVKKK